MIGVLAALCVLGAPPQAPSGTTLLNHTFQRTTGQLERASVYLPPGYFSAETRRYPVLILLHGLGGAGANWLHRGRLVRILDRAIAHGRIEPLIVVMPDGGSGYWTDWSTDTTARFASLVEPETRLWVERAFRSDGRVAIGGISMGGFGALSIALQHPGRFSAVLSLSGALFRQFPTGRSVYLRAFGYPGLMQARFRFINPIHLARLGQADNESIWLDCGGGDSSRFTDGLRAMSETLTSRGVIHIARFRPGRHRWDVWLAGMEEALPWLQASFERALKHQKGDSQRVVDGLRDVPKERHALEHEIIQGQRKPDVAAISKPTPPQLPVPADPSVLAPIGLHRSHRLAEY